MNAGADTTGTEAQTETATDLAEWPTTEGHEQHLAQALEYVNDVIRRAQTLYGYCEGRGETLDGEQAEAALDESEALRARLVSAGETVETVAEASPDLATLDPDEIDDCTAYYSEVREVNESLHSAWESLNDTVGAAEAMTAPSAWGRATEGDEFADTVAEARSDLWQAQAQIESVLLDRFGYTEDDFERPAADFDWN